MKKTPIPPPLDQQLEDLMVYIFKVEKWEKRLDNICGAPHVGPPPCEMSVLSSSLKHSENPAHYSPSYISFTEAWSKSSLLSSCFCPHCKAKVFSHSSMGEIVRCAYKDCGGIMTWPSNPRHT